MKKSEKYHCPFSDKCSYADNLQDKQRYQIIEKFETTMPIFKDKKIKRSEYKCKALEKKSVGCSWIENLNMTDLSLLISFTALKNTHCIAYALKMTEDKD